MPPSAAPRTASPAARSLRRALAVVVIPVILAACGGWEGPPPPLDAEAFEEAESRLEVMIDRGRAGDTDGAEEAFWLVAGFLHRLNTVLASSPDEILFRADLLDAAVRIEQELEGERRPDVLADAAEDAHFTVSTVAELLVPR